MQAWNEGITLPQATGIQSHIASGHGRSVQLTWLVAIDRSCLYEIIQSLFKAIFVCSESTAKLLHFLASSSSVRERENVLSVHFV